MAKTRLCGATSSSRRARRLRGSHHCQAGALENHVEERNLEPSTKCRQPLAEVYAGIVGGEFGKGADRKRSPRQG
jgi:hypothetical protein